MGEVLELEVIQMYQERNPTDKTTHLHLKYPDKIPPLVLEMQGIPPDYKPGDRLILYREWRDGEMMYEVLAHLEAQRQRV